jgi:hypothetical protein
MSNEIDEIVQFDQDDQNSVSNNDNVTELQINVPPQDYTDVASKKQQSLSID